MPEKKTPTVLFIGLGVMGYHMAAHLSKAFPCAIYNRTRSRVQSWAENNQGTEIDRLSDIPDTISTIITCIGKDSDLEEIYLGEHGLLATAPPNTLFIDHTTASASMARKIANAAEKLGHLFLDAPVSGGEQGAINGQLTIMCGGTRESYTKALPYIEAYSKASNLLGGSGAGQLTKMANQIAVAGVIQGLSEAIHFTQQAGLDTLQVIDVISRGAAQSWQMDNRSQTMTNEQYDHGFAVDLMRKDLDIVLSEARKLNATLPLTALIDQFYADVQNMGGGRWDTSSLLKRLQNSSKIKV